MSMKRKTGLSEGESERMDFSARFLLDTKRNAKYLEPSSKSSSSTVVVVVMENLWLNTLGFGDTHVDRAAPTW